MKQKEVEEDIVLLVGKVDCCVSVVHSSPGSGGIINAHTGLTPGTSTREPAFVTTIPSLFLFLLTLCERLGQGVIGVALNIGSDAWPRLTLRLRF